MRRNNEIPDGWDAQCHRFRTSELTEKAYIEPEAISCGIAGLKVNSRPYVRSFDVQSGIPGSRIHRLMDNAS